MNILPSANVAVECKPKVAPKVLNFVGAETFTLDFSSYINSGVIDGIQGLYIDNSANANKLTISVPDTSQNISFPANAQGYVPIICSTFAKFSVSSANSGTTIILPYNFAGPAFIFPANALAFDANGNLLVSDPDISAASLGNAIAVGEYAFGNNDALLQRHLGTEMYYASIAPGATTATIIPAPGSGAYYLKSLLVRMSENATLATAGEITLTISEGSTTLLVLHPYIPAAAVGGIGLADLLKLESLDYVAHNAATALTITLSTALATGTIDVVATGGTTASAL